MMEVDKKTVEHLVQTAFACYQVQQSITRHVPLADLKSLRLVDKQWTQAALLTLKRKSQVVLNSPEKFLKYFDFLESFNFSRGFASYKVVFKEDAFENRSEVIALFSKLWDKCSTSAKTLQLSLPWTCAYPIISKVVHAGQGGGVPLEELVLFVEESDKWTVAEDEEDDQGHSSSRMAISNLISLQLNVSIVLTKEKKVFPFKWAEFFVACPNICHLCIQSEYASGHFCKIVDVLGERRMTLKSLKIGTRDKRLFSEEFMSKLVLLTGPDMEVISLGFLSSIPHESPLDVVLNRAAASLKHVSFVQYRTSNQGTLQTFMTTGQSTFPNLTSLRVTKDLVPSLNFLSKMPNLGRLEIYRDSTVGQHDELANPVIKTRSLSVMPSLRSLVLEMSVPVEHVWKLARWFPNVHRVQMKATDVIARIIFMQWRELRELYLIAELTRDTNDIVRSTLTDEGITGLSKEVFQQLPCQEWGGNRGDIDWESMARMPYIGNLTKLEACKLQVVPDYQTGLTDYSVYYGLLSLPKLASVTLVKTLVSPEAVSALEKSGVSVTVTKD